MPVDYITLDSKNYAMLCGRAGVPVGSNILLNDYRHNDNGRLAIFEPFLFKNQSLQLMKADESVVEIPIGGVLSGEDIPAEILGLNVNPVRIIVQSGEMRGFTWYCSPADADGFIDYANEIMDEKFPRDGESTYLELGFTTRVFKFRDYMKIMNTIVILVSVFIYVFVAALTLVGLTGVISAMSTNIRMRSREFAALQSVGMTYGGLKRMLNLESVMCSAKSLIIGLPAAIVLTYLINLPVRSMFPIPYRFPWLAALVCITAVFLITWITMRYSASRLRGGNIAESIRSEGII